jgi:hypothetical protein
MKGPTTCSRIGDFHPIGSRPCQAHTTVIEATTGGASCLRSALNGPPPLSFCIGRQPVSLDSVSSSLKKLVVILFVAFAALSARAWAYDGPGREWTVRGVGLREWVVVRQTQTVSVRTEFCAGSYHYAVKGPIERWACISIAVVIAFPAVLFFGIRGTRQR